jgi:hypothetical protein
MVELVRAGRWQAGPMLALYGFRLDPVLYLYSFRLFDDVRGRWIRARYRATRAEIAARYARWKTIGEPEMRRPDAGTFGPWRWCVVGRAERSAAIARVSVAGNAAR